MPSMYSWCPTNCIAALEREDVTHEQDTLDLDDEGYPQLPEDVLSLRLSRKKGITRQFVAATRRMYCVYS
jgi:hypothetical protein